MNLGKINYTGKEGNTKGMIVTPSVKNSPQYSFALIFFIEPLLPSCRFHEEILFITMLWEFGLLNIRNGETCGEI